MASETPTANELMALPPEYMNENISHRLFNTSIAIIVIINVIYALFIVSRLFCVERNHWEIWTLYPLSYLWSMSMCITCILMALIGGAGRHMAYLLLNDQTAIKRFLKLQTTAELLYMADVTSPKVCILLLYLQIFTSRRVRIATWVVMSVVVGHFVFTGLIATFTICQPFAFKWDKSIPGGHCANLMAAYKYISIPNILTDLAIVILPFSTLWHLQMSKMRKLGIFLTFLAGSLGIITSIVRFVGFYTVPLDTDLTFLGVETMIYTMVEPCAYFICSCLPGTRPLAGIAYKKSGIGTLLSHTFRTGKSPSSSGNSGNTESIPLGDPMVSHKVSVSASKALGHQSSMEDSRNRFIRVDQTIDV